MMYNEFKETFINLVNEGRKNPDDRKYMSDIFQLVFDEGRYGSLTFEEMMHAINRATEENKF